VLLPGAGAPSPDVSEGGLESVSSALELIDGVVVDEGVFPGAVGALGLLMGEMPVSDPAGAGAGPGAPRGPTSTGVVGALMSCGPVNCGVVSSGAAGSMSDLPELSGGVVVVLEGAATGVPVGLPKASVRAGFCGADRFPDTAAGSPLKSAAGAVPSCGPNVGADPAICAAGGFELFKKPPLSACGLVFRDPGAKSEGSVVVPPVRPKIWELGLDERLGSIAPGSSAPGIVPPI
jgi:hypothetical protein